jgi:hypothetical protein
MSELTDKEKAILQGIYAIGGSVVIRKGKGFDKVRYFLEVKIVSKLDNDFIITWLRERFGGNSLNLSNGFRWTCRTIAGTKKFIKSISDADTRYIFSDLQLMELDVAKEFMRITIDSRPIGKKYELEKAKKLDMKRALYERMIVIRPYD